MVFGHRGIAFPSPDHTLTVSFEETPGESSLQMHSVTVDTSHPEWESYIGRIVSLCEAKSGEKFVGKLTISGNLPVGKGMGSSTALVIATCKSLLEQDADEAFCKRVEDTVNPSNSGLDFAVIWSGKPLVFKKGEAPQYWPLSTDLLHGTTLIDTGTPKETTSELVAWIKEKAKLASGEPGLSAQVDEALKMIGQCTERILQQGTTIAQSSLKAIIRDHHQAQVALGVVPESVQALIKAIEEKGGAAKVLGAGARTGGGGMVLQIP